MMFPRQKPAIMSVLSGPHSLWSLVSLAFETASLPKSCLLSLLSHLFVQEKVHNLDPSFPSNFEKKFHLIMWFVVWNVNSASECHVFLWFLVLNWNFKIRCSIYTSKLFFFLPQRKNTYFEHELSESVQGHLFDLGLRIGIKQSCFIP